MLKKISVLIFHCLVAVIISAQDKWPTLTQNAKPWARWWWMGSAVDKKNITRLLREYNKVGFGGIEIVPIYGAKGYESRYIKYLSPQWIKMLDFTTSQATALNMGVYMSVGTGWPIGGPQVSTNDAATKLVIQSYTLHEGESLKDKIIINDPAQKGVARLCALTAYSKDAGKVLLLTDKVTQGGSLNWSPADGEWELFAAFAGKTKQLVKRAAPGGEGFTLDHFSGNALNNYFKSWDTSFGNSSHGVKAFYNDSYEVYNADWTPDFFGEFERRRHYDLRLHLKELASKDTTDNIARIKCDYRETMADLMLQNFAMTFTNWSHGKKALSLDQAHGSPANLIDLYAAFDIAEAETFGSSYFSVRGLRRDSNDVRNADPDPMMLKFASSASHLMGHSLTSCETFTWLTEHFKTSWSQCKPEAEQALLSGINHIFYHGITYSPSDVSFPGWLFYASINAVPDNSLWDDIKGLNDYLARCQAILQSGEPDNELAIYWPIYDIWSNAKGMDMPLAVHSINEWLRPTDFYRSAVELQRKGFSFDFVSDKLLHSAKVQNANLGMANSGAKYRVLVVPRCKLIPVQTLTDILKLATEGALVVFQQLPEDVPGWYDLEKKRMQLQSLLSRIELAPTRNEIKTMKFGKGEIIVAENIPAALEYAKIKGETLADSGLRFIRRSTPGGKYYYIVNHTAKNIDEVLPLQTSATSVILMNPLTGETGLADFSSGKNSVAVRLQLKSGESIVVQTLKRQTLSQGKVTKWKYEEPSGNPIALTSEWNLHFIKGGPVLPADKSIKALRPWSELTDDSTTQSFSGTAVYSTTLDLAGKKATDYLLMFDKIYESARVLVNGTEAGIVWSLPFEIRIGKYLKPGKNSIAIEVSNLMANRVRYMDRNGIAWRNYHEINFVNINYKSFDASNWPVQPSGLDGPINLIPLK